MSLTGASAEEWVAVKPGTEGALALGLAHVISDGKNAAFADYAPAAVEKITGVNAKRIERLAKELAAQKPAVAIVAGPALAHTNGFSTALAVNALNALLGSVREPGRPVLTPSRPRPPRPKLQ